MTIDGNQIVVEVAVTGEKKNATAEVIFSNDMFMKLQSAALNPTSTVGELMANAGLNTLIGMGTVFVVLILISLIISCFKVIPKIQENAARKKAAQKEVAGVDNAVTQIVEQETVEEAEEDDCELVAVIAAAIAASEGAATTDGFVVRSIRRR
nr:OadG family protein [uncultured Acetatifactor sp.]